MTTFFKAVRPDGGSFFDPSFRWLPDGWQDGDALPDEGWLVEHPNPARHIGMESGAPASEYLSVATVPTECIGMEWPCVLLAVEAVGRACLDDWIAHKRRVKAARVVGVLDPHEALGPQGRHVAALIEHHKRLSLDEALQIADLDTPDQYAQRAAACDAAGRAARGAARGTAFGVALDIARGVLRSAVVAEGARDAAKALVVRDLISTEHYDTLTMPWRTTIGPIHPDDPEADR